VLEDPEEVGELHQSVHGPGDAAAAAHRLRRMRPSLRRVGLCVTAAPVLDL
jgi:hypothetical protein